MKENSFGNIWERDRIRYLHFWFWGHSLNSLHLFSYSIFCSPSISTPFELSAITYTFILEECELMGTIPFIDHWYWTSPCSVKLNQNTNIYFSESPVRWEYCCMTYLLNGFSFVDFLLFCSHAWRIRGQNPELNGYIFSIPSPWNALLLVVYGLSQGAGCFLGFCLDFFIITSFLKQVYNAM